MGIFKKKKFDKNIILHVGRKDKIVAYVTKGRRCKTEKDGIHYEIQAPGNKKIIYKTNDIPTKFFSSSGVIEIYTPDFEQFVPCSSELSGKDKLHIHLLTNEQKLWYTKSVKDDVIKTANKSWWNENKTIILTILVLLALIAISWILMSGYVDIAGKLAQSDSYRPIIQNITAPPV